MFFAGKKNFLTRACIVAAVYFLVARAGIVWSQAAGVVAPLWPASGIEVAAAVLFGPEIWLAIFAGAIAFNFAEGRPPNLTMWIATSATIETIIPAIILRRLGFSPKFEGLRDCLAFCLVAAIAAAASACAGVGGLKANGFIASTQIADAWREWFLSNVTGIWIVAGFLLACRGARPRDWKFSRILEALGLLIVMVILSRFAFVRETGPNIWRPYMIFPVLVVAAIRFGPCGATAATLIGCGVSAWAALKGIGPFQTPGIESHENILGLQIFFGIVSITGMALACSAESRRVAERRLREQSANMIAAQRVAHFGSWELHLQQTDNQPDATKSETLTWSDECYRLFGLPPASAVNNDIFFARVHPDDRETVARALAQAIATRGEFTVTHRILLPAGETRHVRQRAKVFLNDETAQPTKIIGTVHDITDTQHAADQLRESEERYRLLADNATDMISRHNTLGVFLYASPAARHLLDAQPEDLVGRDLFRLCHPADTDTVRQHFNRIATSLEFQTFAYRVQRPDHSHLWVETTARSLHDPHTGEVNEIISITRDITERRALESQLQQAQKMEAIGRLAGGIAHDFNNLLTVISGYVSLILADLPEHHPTREPINEIHKAAERAAALTRQLLAFSRRSILDPKVVDLNTIIRDADKMIRRLVGEDIELHFTLAPGLKPTKIDRTQLDQVILNLVTNARDAMPQGGKLTIETSNVHLDENYTRTNTEAQPGPHVLLSINDTGQGMDTQILTRIFEPFFSTKAVGRGTGLGLSVVHGIVKQSGGHINVYSEPSLGSSFKIYFPCVDEPVTEEKTTAPDLKNLVPGRGTVLLVEDEEAVRVFAERVLFDAGYRVLTAENGVEAIKVADRFLKDIHILVTDVVMPRMGGRQLAEELHQRRPDLKVLFMSGYTDDAVLRHGVLSSESAFLQKPFTAVDLSRRISEILSAK